MDYSDCSVLFDTEAIYDVCGANLDVCSPTFTNLNRVVSQVVSSCSASYRFSGAINVDITEFQMNLVPYPWIHFPLCSYALQGCLADPSTQQITDSCFQPHTQLIKWSTERQIHFLLHALPGRCAADGNQLRHSRHQMQENIQFVDSAPAAFKIGINYQVGRRSQQRSMFMLN